MHETSEKIQLAPSLDKLACFGGRTAKSQNPDTKRARTRQTKRGIFPHVTRPKTSITSLFLRRVTVLHTTTQVHQCSHSYMMLRCPDEV